MMTISTLFLISNKVHSLCLDRLNPGSFEYKWYLNSTWYTHTPALHLLFPMFTHIQKAQTVPVALQEKKGNEEKGKCEETEKNCRTDCSKLWSALLTFTQCSIERTFLKQRGWKDNGLENDRLRDGQIKYDLGRMRKMAWCDVLKTRMTKHQGDQLIH